MDPSMVIDPLLMNRVPAHFIHMLQQDTPEMSSIHFDFVKSWPIWDTLMQCYPTGQALDLTYIYNRKYMATMVGLNADWAYAIETNSLGLALYLCDIGEEPANCSALAQTAFNHGCPWLVYLLRRRFNKHSVIILDVGWSRHIPVDFEGRVENCMELIKTWATKNYEHCVWSLLVPKHYTLTSSLGWTTLLEIPGVPWELFWTHRKPSVYLSQQSITSLFRANMDDDFRWSVLTSESGWGACIVDTSYQIPTSPELRERIHETWPVENPTMSSWLIALQRADRHAIRLNRNPLFWPKEALLSLLQSKSPDLLPIIEELDTWHEQCITTLMCDVEVGRAIMLTKNDDLMYHALKRTNNSCYDITAENHRLLIQCRMIKSLCHLHIKRLQQFDVTSFTTAVSEGFYKLMELLLKRFNIPHYDEELWYNQLLCIFVTQSHTPTGKDMATLLLQSIPPNTVLSPRLQNQINCMSRCYS
jgi:hypothetical protein